jgi:hypothetical protein
MKKRASSLLLIFEKKPKYNKKMGIATSRKTEQKNPSWSVRRVFIFFYPCVVRQPVDCVRRIAAALSCAVFRA